MYTCVDLFMVFLIYTTILFLSVVQEGDVSKTINELLECWNQFLISDQRKNKEIGNVETLKEDKIKILIEQQQKSDSEKKKAFVDIHSNGIKARLLEQYAEVSGDDER